MLIGADQQRVRNQHSLLWSAAAAALVMAVGMGFGRFAFTGVYPIWCMKACSPCTMGLWRHLLTMQDILLEPC